MIWYRGFWIKRLGKGWSASWDDTKSYTFFSSLIAAKNHVDEMRKSIKLYPKNYMKGLLERELEQEKP